MIRLVACSLVAGLCATSAGAEERVVPPFLEGTALFSREEGFCPGNPNPPATEGTLQVSKAGIYGYEVGCTFLQFLPERDPETGEIYTWVATAQCGDDSGINRPDQFTLIHNEFNNTLTVQSQTEYAAATAMLYLDRDSDKDPFEQTAWLSGDYPLCPTY